MKQIVILTIILIICGHSLPAQTYFNKLDHADGLPQINVVSIYQDETGAMWFGTASGLCRYNGSSMQVFRSSPEYPELTRNTILSITGNGEGAVYIRTEFDLIRYDVAGEQFRRISEGVTGMFYGGGKLWFIVNDALHTWSENDESVSFYSSTGGITSNTTFLRLSDDGSVWVGGRNGLGVIKVSNGGNKSEIVLDDINVYSLFIDSEGLVWAGTRENGVYVLDGDGTVKWRFVHSRNENSISNDSVRTIAEDEHGTIWIGTAFGLNSFDKSAGLWTNHIPDDTRPGSMSDYSVFAIYRDVQNTMWVGTYYGGVNYFNPRRDIFRYYSASSMISDRLSFPFVGNMIQDAEGNLWICTEGGGLNCLDLRTRKFTRYFYDEYAPERTSRYHLKSIYHDPGTGKLYIGIPGVGLWVFDTKTRKGTLYDRPEWAVTNIQAWRGEIVAKTGRGFYKIDTGTDTVVPFTRDAGLSALLNKDYAYTFLIDSRDRIWLSTSSGLKRIDLNTLEEKDYNYGDPRSPGKSTVISFVETHSGELFLGTLGSGLFRYNPATDDFDNCSKNGNTQISNFCYHISEMTDGNLLILHDNAFSIFDPRQSKTVYHSTDNFPLSGFFDGNSSFITRDGEIFFGGIDGLASVEETRLMDFSQIDYSLRFDGLLVDGKRIRPGDETKILSKTLPLTDKIRLRHDQNDFSIVFATSDYSQQDAPSDYEYRLDGLDPEWFQISSSTITYLNVDPGRYTLFVREKDPGKSDAEKKIRALGITVSPPFYKTAFAQVAYALLSVGLVVGIILLLMWRYRMHTSLEMERKDKENIERLNRMKLGFFTGVSHEFRTPLTLIMAQIEHVLSARELEPGVKREISKVLDNASHMRDLISELLDFRKAEQGFQRLKVERVDLVEYIDGIRRSFTEYADKHRIKYVYYFPQEGVEAYIDCAQFKKAIYNLLSNAFKYTHDGGEITIRLLADEYIHVLVEDNGIGISSEEFTRIFERFYQIEYRTSGFSLGTGIGLALTKEIIESHKGEISVESTPDKGSVFDIRLQKGSAHFDGDELSPQPATECGSALSGIPMIPGVANGDYSADQPYSILIVEDNDKLLSLLSEIFSGECRIYTAVNGKQGLEMAEKHLPDLILADVMMPEMSGKEMCRRIKNDSKLSHIPVVMLTSLDSVDDTVEGLMSGADDYIAKPFNVEVLKARCTAAVRNRRVLYRNATQSRGMAGVEIRSEQDRKFMEKAEGIVRANFDNPGFDMNMLAAEMGMGRTSLYTAMKEISGMTPNEFTLATKLRESTELLRNHLHFNVSEIADKLGFSSTKYFSKCFKTFYGVTPVQWRKEATGTE